MTEPPPPPPPPPPPSGAPVPSGGVTPPVGNPLVGYWKRVVLERYAKFDGRAGRPEYWWFALANFLVAVGIYIIIAVLSSISDALGVLGFVLLAAYWLALLVPSLAVAVRRLHDSGKSGWFLLMYLIPCAGPIIVLVFLVLEGTRGPNQFGDAAS